MGYNIAIIPSDLQRAAMKAMPQTLKAIQIYGNNSSVAHTLLSFKERGAVGAGGNSCSYRDPNDSNNTLNRKVISIYAKIKYNPIQFFQYTVFFEVFWHVFFP
jgi:hypothetical protein